MPSRIRSSRRSALARTTELLIAIALGTTLLLQVDVASASRSKSNVEIRPNIGIGPVDLGDTKRAVDRRLDKGRRSRTLTDMYSYRASGGRIDVFFRLGRGGRVRPSSKAYLVQTR